ncbi:MAG: right-handed parallel beta-helix repeat-containing protein [Deltaproteobacteria bacterium]|nr:right-handed parallel beta-helix repeat-containing protein [Deltaproteobacteria bacterium]
MFRATTLALGVALVGGCSGPTSTYCDGTHACADSRWPRCDYATHTCMPADDGGAPDAPAVDARQDDVGTTDAPTDGTTGDAECGSSGACTDPATPICAGGTCRGCQTPAECAARDPAVPACDLTGHCVECVGSTDCTTATKPICGAQTCRACQNAPECAARSAATPACHSNGSCVECRQNTDCAAKVDTPVCDLATSTCVPCTSDDQCARFCDRGTGRCVVDADILFVDAIGPSCPTPGPGAGTLADPHCEISYAVANLGLKRYVYVKPGVYAAVSVWQRAFRLRAESGARIVPTAADSTGLSVTDASDVEVDGLRLTGGGAVFAGISITSGGQLTLRNVKVDGLAALGAYCGYATFSIDRSELLSNPGGGLDLISCTSTITNTVIARNGTASADLGGVRITTPRTGTSFINNTVVSNTAKAATPAGILCADPAQVVNAVVWFNTPTQVSATNCSTTYSNVAQAITGVGNINQTPSFMSASTGDYRYMPGSPGIDVATALGAPALDFDGYPRPYGSAPDMGAFEWHP